MTEYKLVIFGESGVGKSTLIIRLVNNVFAQDYDPTVEDSFRKQTVVDGEACLLDILDTAEQEEPTAMHNQYFRECQGFLLIYSITSRSSFQSMKVLRDQCLYSNENEKVPLILVGNKCDLKEERQVTTEEGQNLAQSFGCPFLETSAKTPINVDLAFHDLVREIRKFNQMNSSLSSPSPSSSSSSSSESKKDKKDCLIM